MPGHHPHRFMAPHVQQVKISRIIPLLSRLQEEGIKISLEKDQLKIVAAKGKLTPLLVRELKSRREEILDFLRTGEEKRVKYAAIEPTEKRDYYLLSSAQKRLYVLQQMELAGTGYNISVTLPFYGSLDGQRMEETFRRLIRRHENLRTAFEIYDSQPVQRVHAGVEFSLHRIEPGQNRDEESRAREVAALLNGFIRSFDLSRAPLLRVGVLRTPGNLNLLIVDMHHIISDGTSHEILTKDFMALYTGRELKPLRLQYRDFSTWQQELFETGRIKPQEEFWRGLFSGPVPKLSLPADYPRPASYTFAGDVYEFRLGAAEASRFRTLNKENNSTLFMNMLSAYNVLLHKYSGQTDIVTGAGVAGRPHADLQGVIGMFVNMLALRHHPAGHKTYAGFLKEVTENSLKAFENQDVQFEELVDQLELERDPSRNPLFDVTIVVQNFDRATSSPSPAPPPGAPVREGDTAPFAPGSRTSKFDMTLFLVEIGDEIFCTLEYYTGIFQRETIQRMVRHFLTIIRQVTEDSRIPLSRLDLLEEREKQLLLVEFNATAAAYPREKTIPGLFAELARRLPGQVAAIYGDEFITYGELDRGADRLAAYLRGARWVQANGPVGILMERSTWQIMALLGVLKAGAAYLPLEDSLPEARLKHMIDDAGVGMVISQRKFIRTLNRLQWECGSCAAFLCVDSSDIHAEEESRENELMDTRLWDYVAESASDEITGGGWFTSYTGEPFSKQEMEEYGDNVLKKLRPLLHQQMKVLEIGCGSGITMYRIAPLVSCYYGTDLSAGIIAYNENHIRQHGCTNIKLSCLPAHQVDRIEARDFDLVIINSVIQSFHGHNYLRTVLGKALDLLGNNGYLFVGDVLDQQLKPALIREMVEFKYSRRGSVKTKTDWSADLFVSRSFFSDLRVERREICDVRFSGKIYTLANELTKFRYDVLLTVEKSHWQEREIPVKRKFQLDQRVLAPLAGTPPKPQRAVKATDLAYIIYTSGSSGQAKGVMVEHRNVLRLVKNSNVIDSLHLEEGQRFLLTGAFAFDITTFEVWGFLLNGVSLVMVEKSVIPDAAALQETVVKHGITVIHFTPQLFSQLVAYNPEIFARFEYIMVGGDMVRPEPVNRLRHKYSRLNLLHMYGPTENTTFSTFFPIEGNYRERIPIGTPVSNSTVYILDNHGAPQLPGVWGELYTGGDGVARGYLNRPELTAEGFVFNRSYKSYRTYISKNKTLTPHPSPLYKTGDLARWLPNGTLEFWGRIDQQVKIRGYRIELEEIEAQLLKRQEVKAAVVLAKEDQSGDKNLVAYIVAAEDFDLSGLKDDLQVHLPDYMIPAYFIPLTAMPLNPNGKIDRKALPDPEVMVEGEYIAPRDELERRLVDLWSGVLHIEDALIGIDANFFQLGGHSLKATILASRIHKELDTKIPLTGIFQNQTIRSLSTYLRGTGENRYAGLQAVEKRDYYGLSSPQRRLYLLQVMNPGSTVYNVGQFFILDGAVDTEKLRRVFEQLIYCHESLRTSYVMLEKEPVQRVGDRVAFEIQDGGPGGVEDLRHLIRPFDLGQAPLLRVGLIKAKAGQTLLLVDLHHITADGISQTLLTRDFMALYRENRCPCLNLQYKDYCEWQRSRKAAGDFRRQEEYWLDLFREGVPVLDLPTDWPRPDVQDFAGGVLHFELGEGETAALREIARSGDATLFMVLLALFSLFLAKLGNREEVVVGTPAAGRSHADLENMIGMLVNTLVIYCCPAGEKTFSQFLKEVKEQTLKALENQDYPFEDLVAHLVEERDMVRNPLFDVMFSVQSMIDPPGEEKRPGSVEALELEVTTTAFDLDLNVLEKGEKLDFRLGYRTNLFGKEKIERFILYFKEVVARVVESKHSRLAEIKISHDLMTAKRDIIDETRDWLEF